MAKKLIAQCFQDGKIFFSTYRHKNALTILKGKSKKVKRVVTAKAVLGYDNKTLLVPGVSSAKGPIKRIDKLFDFISLCDPDTQNWKS